MTGKLIPYTISAFCNAFLAWFRFCRFGKILAPLVSKSVSVSHILLALALSVQISSSTLPQTLAATIALTCKYSYT